MTTVEAFQRGVLTPAAVEVAIAKAFRLHAATAEDTRHRREALERELRRLERELSRLTDALAAGEAVESLRAALATRERRRAEIRAHLEHLDGMARRAPPGRGRVDDRLRQQLTDWQGLLGGQPVQARQLLWKLLAGRLVFTPREDLEGRFYDITGTVSYARVWPMLVGAEVMAPPGGFAVHWSPQVRGVVYRRAA